MVRAQMKIQQTALVLMAITLLFVLVGLFFVSFKFSSLKSSATELEERNSLILSSKLTSSPEFSCEEAFKSKRVNCIDSDKLILLIGNSEKYSNFFGVENIEVRKIGFSEEILCTDKNYPDCNYFRLFNEDSSNFDHSSFVALCKKDLNLKTDCDLAKLIVKYNKK